MKTALVVGGGVAGCVVAHRLTMEGLAVTLVHEERPGTASSAGAGILSPISGRRFALHDSLELFLPAALDFYSRLQSHGGERIFVLFPILREISSSEELALWEKRKLDPLLPRYASVQKQDPCWSSAEGANPTVRIEGGGWVNFSALRAACREGVHEILAETLRASDWKCEPSGVMWNQRRWDVAVICGGAFSRFDFLPEQSWTPAAGDVLKVRIPGWDSNHIRVRGIFTVPLGQDIFLCGATYDRKNLSPVPEEANARTLLETLADWTGTTPELLAHARGIRPTFQSRLPVADKHPELPGCYVLNGLGSKAALQLPWLSGALCRKILEDSCELSAFSFPQTKAKAPRLTALAHEAVAEFLNEGSLVLDATAGNGHDTVFLAACCGLTGRVAAFDVQQRAVSATVALVRNKGVGDRVDVHHASFNEFAERLPPDWMGRISVVMLNLGYLPGGDRSLCTTSGETRKFLADIASWLAPRALISILAYRGQPGGLEEHAAIEAWSLEQEGAGWSLRRSSGPSPLSPELFLLERLRR